jgi:hypothetical protein
VVMIDWAIRVSWFPDFFNLIHLPCVNKASGQGFSSFHLKVNSCISCGEIVPDGLDKKRDFINKLMRL